MFSPNFFSKVKSMNSSLIEGECQKMWQTNEKIKFLESQAYDSCT